MRTLGTILSLALVSVLSLLPVEARAAVFDATDTATLQSALTTAAGNEEDDTINISAGIFAVGVPLSYLPAADENFGLAILGAGAASTILDGASASQILNVSTVTATADSAAHILVQGITFRNGSGGNGGALSVQTVSANVTVQMAAFTTNVSALDGGGLLVQTTSGAVTVLRNSFQTNTAGNDGGGMRAASLAGTVLVRDNVFTGNAANRDGGGARLESNEAVLLVNNVVAGNAAATGDGGGLRVEGADSTITITNNTLTGNSAALSGGGVAVKLAGSVPSASAGVSNNIIHGNSAHGPLGGGDVFVENDPEADGTAAGTMLWKNDLSSVAGTILLPSMLTGNIDAPPLLDPTFHLLPGSPCIDAGVVAAFSLPDLDIDGEPRVLGGSVDIGADEFSAFPAPPLTPVAPELALLRLVARPKRIGAGQLSVLRGKLTDAQGLGMRGKRVRIWTGPHPVKTLTTSALGTFSLQVRPRRTKNYIAIFRGDARFAPSYSPVARVFVRWTP